MVLEEDKKFMLQALCLARTQMGKTSPDPMVGAVLVKHGKIISSGYHAQQTTPHAEAYAIQKAGQKTKGATLYLNLEPCCHYGYNPPCTNAIINAGIKRVVSSMEDPNPLVSGKGFRELRKAGIKVDVGILEEEARQLNEAFIKHITTGLPFVILKNALSLDGKIATNTGESLYISGKASRQHVHAMRAYVDAVMTSVNTVKMDDPKFTVRDTGSDKITKRDPKKIILDVMAQIPLRSHVLSHSPEKTIVVVSENAPYGRVEAIRKRGAVIMKVRTKNGAIDMKKLMIELGDDNITSIMIEAGGNIAASAIKSGIVDKVAYFIAPKIVGGKDALTPVEGHGIERLKDLSHLRSVKYTRFGEDILVEGYI